MFNRAVADKALVACPDCDLLQRLPELEPGASARCLRCGTELWRRRVDALDRTLAFTLAAAVLYAVANAVPMLGLRVVGLAAETTVVGGAEKLWSEGQPIVAILVLFTAVIAPAAQIAFLLGMTLGARRNPTPRWVGTLLRCYPTACTWSMVEVMILGVLVALIKISDYASVIPGLAMYSLGGLVFLLAASQASFDPREVWDRVEWVGGDGAH